MNVLPLEKKLGVNFSNTDLLLEALTHRSYKNEHPEWHVDHNERLEFLGDAVLEIIVTEYLFKEYPRNPEGDLTAWRAALVNSTMLGKIAEELNVNEFLLLSKGEMRDKGKARHAILANALEAIIGAMYLDRGLEAVREFVNAFVLPKLPNIIEGKLFQDAKSLFQEMSQEEMGITPRYEVLDEWGPDHDKHFRVGVYLAHELIAEGEGMSKQEAQRLAAQHALDVKGWK